MNWERIRHQLDLNLHYIPAIIYLFLLSILFLIQPQRKVGKDTAFFIATGQYLLEGRFVYQHIWDLKPPAIHLTSGILAMFSSGSWKIQYILSVVLMVFLLGLMLVLTAETIRELTGSHSASVVAALIPLSFPTFMTHPLTAMRPALIVAALLPVVAYCVMDDRPLFAGAIAALMAGYWQPMIGIPFVLVTVAAVTELSVKRVISGGAITTVILVCPFVISGALPELIIQVIIAPLATQAYDPGVIQVIQHSHGKFGPNLPIIILTIAGSPIVAKRAIANRNPTYLFVIGSFGWLLYQIFEITFNGLPDAYPFITASGLVAGLVVTEITMSNQTERKHLGTLIVIGTAVIAFTMWLNLSWWSPEAGYYPNKYLVTDFKCHLRGSAKERRWIDQISRLDNGDCLHQIPWQYAKEVLL